MQRRELGKRGEETAVRFLQAQGYKILAQNYRCRYGELDVVVTKDDILAFVEVRTWFSGRCGPPEASLTWRKRRHMRDAALFFLQERESKGGSSWRIRFDLVTVGWEEGRVVVRHYPGVF